MYITLDVVFHEDTMYFSSKSDLQEEKQNEVLTLGHDTDVHEELKIFEVGGSSFDDDQEMEVIEPLSFDEDVEPQEFSVPNQSSAEDAPNSMFEPPIKKLPPRQNRGIPKSTYEPEISSRARYPMNNYVSNHRLSESNQALVNQLSIVSIPNSVQEALMDPRWREAMNDEMKSLKKNDTWELVDCPPGKKIVGCRWVYTVKYKADGTIERFKARLVAKGYTQTYGVDYTETFAPVAKVNTIRVLLSLAANFDWPLQQFDVKNAFLHGELTEEVYMELPSGCNIPEACEKKVCRLKKSLYGLKQSPRAWFGRFTKSMKAFGYSQSNADHTLFLKRQQGKITALIVYVDDMVVTGNDVEERKALQSYLSKEFEMKDLGPLKFFL
ncbi:retrovirus-related Pol polyprotein from transposon TNT 1-94, partial [Trifolium pratense]